MHNDKITELINKKIDLEITSEENTELEKYFDAHPNALKEYETLKSLSGYFKDHEVNPPSEIKDKVMYRVQQLRDKRVGSNIVNTRNSFIGWLKPQMAYSFATGAIAALLIFSFILKPNDLINSQDSNGLSGTFVFNQKNQTTENLIYKQFSFSEDENSLSVAVSDELTVVTILLNNEKSIKFNFSINSEITEFVAFEQSVNSNGNIIIGNESFSITQSGKGIYTFFFDNQKISPYVISYHITSDVINISDELTIKL